MAAQFSVACGLPLSVLLLKGLPTRGGGNAIDALAPLYAAVMLIFGLLISWCAQLLSRGPLNVHGYHLLPPAPCLQTGDYPDSPKKNS